MSATDNITVTVGWIARHTPKGAGAGGREAAILDIAQDLPLRELHETGALDTLVFKGGTALRKLYAGNQGRFSLDLDFSLAAPADPETVVLDLVAAIDGAEAELASTVSTRYAFLAGLDAEERQLAEAREQDRDLALRLLAKLPGARLAYLGHY